MGNQRGSWFMLFMLGVFVNVDHIYYVHMYIMSIRCGLCSSICRVTVRYVCYVRVRTRRRSCKMRATKGKQENEQVYDKGV